MPLIKPRTRGKQIVRHIARLDRENTETLHAYAAFLGESTDYVLNQVIDTGLLLPATLDVVVAGRSAAVRRGAAIYAAQRTERRDAAGT